MRSLGLSEVRGTSLTAEIAENFRKERKAEQRNLKTEEPERARC